jgi:Stage II sporulation protein E (SpoIIE)/GAF domain
MTGLQDRLAARERLRALDAAALLDTPAEQAFDRLTELAIAALGVPISLISLVTDDRQFFKSQSGLPSPVAEARETPLSHSFCQHVVADRRPLVIDDTRRDERVSANLAIPELGAIAYAGVPLRTRDGEVLGTFCAIDQQPRAWSPRDVAVLESLAAATMDIVRLRGEALDHAEMGARLQAALAPEPPTLEGAELRAIYRPGEQRLLVGGDFYVCAQRSADGSIWLLLGDVAGHGPEAAAFAISLASAWRTMLHAPADLAEMMRRLNDVALDQRPDVGWFATAIACTISGGRLELCSAGHPPAVLLGPDGPRQAREQGGMPLGIRRDGRWEADEGEAPDGVFLYTDGLVEGRAAPGSRERLGIEPILAELAAGCRRLEDLADLAERRHGHRLADDVAALLLTLR